MTSDNPKVAIVIPTMNRSDFVIRQLDYYADVGCRHTIYVGDSSIDTAADLTAEAVQRLKGRLNVVHVRLPSDGIGQAIRQMLYTASEPYAAFLGDDDFFVPSALDECVDFLEANPEYATANGLAFVCGIDRPTGDYEITSSARYGLSYVQAGSASERLRQLMDRSFDLFFSVQHMDHFRKQMDAAVELPDWNFGILLQSALAVIQGNSKQIESFFLVRLMHPTPYALPKGFNWLADKKWFPSYEMFCDRSAELMAQKDRISVEEARCLVEPALRIYVSKRLAPDLVAGFAQRSAGPYQRFRSVIRTMPRLKKALIKVRSTLPIRDRFSLDRLLRPSSPYYDDFMPIYNSRSETVSGNHDRQVD